jgi:hypothetical protein
MIRRRNALGMTASLALAAVGAPAYAHHSSAMYDRAHPVSVEAEVKTFQWVNPHVYLTVVVREKAGAEPRTLTIEMTSPGVLTRAGWSKRTFTPGDKIALEFAPMKSGSAGGYFLKAGLPNGKVMTYDFGERGPVQ